MLDQYVLTDSPKKTKNNDYDYHERAQFQFHQTMILLRPSSFYKRQSRSKCRRKELQQRLQWIYQHFDHQIILLKPPPQANTNIKCQLTFYVDLQNWRKLSKGRRSLSGKRRQPFVLQNNKKDWSVIRN